MSHRPDKMALFLTIFVAERGALLLGGDIDQLQMYACNLSLQNGNFPSHWHPGR